MSVSEKIKAIMQLKNIKQSDLANSFDMSPQAMRNKFHRGSWSAEDLIRIAEATGCEICFKIDEKQSIILDGTDVRDTLDTHKIVVNAAI